MILAARSDRGFALVPALATLVVLLLLALAAASITIAARGGASRSTTSTMALQAADQAAYTGLEQLDVTHIDTGTHQPCVTGGSGASLGYGPYYSGGNWCPAVAVAAPGAVSAAYYVSKATVSGSTITRYVVGTATVGRATRRVRLTISATVTPGSGSPIFGAYAAISHLAIYLGNAYYVTGGVRSDQGITLDGTAPPTTNHCHVTSGPITPGPGATVTIRNNATYCGNATTPATSNFAFTTITDPGADDDSRICTAGQDPCTNQNNIVTWNKTNKTLTTANSGTVTLTGNVYRFCSLVMNNGTITIKPANGKPVAIYILDPTKAPCQGQSLPNPVLSIQNQSVFNNQTGLGAGGLAIYSLSPAGVDFNNASSNSLITAGVWAPQATVQVRNQAGVKGAVAANSLTFGGNAPGIVYDTTVGNIVGGAGPSSTGSSSQSSYVECPADGLTPSAPDSGC